MPMHNCKSMLKAGASFVALSVALAVSSAASAGSLPAHGHFVSGEGSINKANRSLTVKQSSTTGIIDWKSFSVSKHSGVSFDNGSGATLNRVTGGNLSTIAGSLHASGTLYLMNSSGVIISGTGRVVTGGSFVASSGNITNGAFENDKLRIKNGHADVVNHGSITAAAGVRLVGDSVTNTGSISASRVKLWARHQLAIGGEVRAQKGKVGGNVIADGHTIDVSGRIDASATGAHKKGGTIVIDARGGTTVSGKLVAKGGRHGTGGFIETSGEQVHIADSARISTLANHGQAGTWLIDPNDFVIAASGGDITGATLSTELNGGVVDIQSSGGGGGDQGEVIVDDNVTWSSSSTLTLDASADININATIKITGAGGLVLVYGDTSQTGDSGNAGSGDLVFNGGRVAFTDVTSGNNTALSIEGIDYTLENNISDLKAAITGNAHGNYALANNYDASGDNSGAAYTTSPITTAFAGTFEGLGNTISNLTIDDLNDSEVGLFKSTTSQGTIRDISLVNVNITADSAFNGGGALVGGNIGTLKGVSVSGFVTGGGDIGGVAGTNSGTISNSSSSATVVSGGTSATGGLVGSDSGSISGSSASGNVTINGGDGGGLVGNLSGATISNSFATGAVTGGDNTMLGGLVGTSNGTVSASYATGDVTGGAGAAIGGLLGENSGEGVGTLRGSYASGNVTATGGQGALVGGLVGYNANGAHITDSYAMGNVSAPSGASVDMGGLVGENTSPSTIDESYELGAVTGGGSTVGALIGDNTGSAGVTTALYYNSTANPTLAAVGSGTLTNGGGLARADMETASNFVGWNFNTTEGGSGFVIVDQNGSLNNSGSAAGGTTPLALAEFSTTITNAHQLQLMEVNPTADYVLANNIDASGTAGGDVWDSQGFIAVGGNGLPAAFSGTFDGQYHVISGLYINSPSLSVGLFGAVTGVIENVGLVDGSVTAQSSGADLGELVGYNSHGIVENSYATGTVFADNFETSGGGLVGFSTGTISNSSAAVVVTLPNSVSPSQVSSAGGLVGQNGGLVTDSFATGNVSGGEYTFVGGLAGYSGGTVQNSFATGSISAGLDSVGAGGLVGYAFHASITGSYATGNVTGSSGAIVGGLVGISDDGTIDKTYATGAVSSSGNIGAAGGLVGIAKNAGSINESYELGAATLSGGSEVAGLVAYNFSASLGGTTAVYYNSDANSVGVLGTGITNGGGLSRTQMQNSANFAWTFGTTGGGSGWVIVDNDGTLNNASGAGGTTPMLLSEYATTITSAHQLQLMELDKSADYKLANDIDASGTAGGDVWGSQGFVPIGGNSTGQFTGTFDGQGHVIDGLTIVSAGPDISDAYSGLFGKTLNATISNVGLTNVSVTGFSDSALAGGLIGQMTGTTAVSNVYVTGQVSAGTASAVGGIVGDQEGGSISQTWANANVTAGANAHSNLSEAGEISGLQDGGTINQSFASGTVIGGSGATIGGLVGFISSNALIDNSYAMVAVIGSGTNSAGGIAGYEALATIENSFATGVVTSGSQNGGGLVGSGGNGSGSNLINTYWDTETSGQSQPSGFGAQAGATAETMATLQGSLPSGFGTSVWGTGNGLYPYLLWQYPSGTPQAVSGIAYSDAGTTALSDGSVSLLIGGNAAGTAATGANGYYYFLEAPGTISGTWVLTYISGIGVSFADNVTGTVSGLNIDNNTLNETTAGSSYTTLASDLTTAISGNSTVQSLVSGLANLGIDYTGNTSFTIDSAINLGSGTLSLTGSGGINQTAAIQASNLLLGGAADYTLDNTSNAIATVAGHTTGSLDLTSDEALTVGSVDGTNGLYIGGGATLATTSGGITITQLLTADNHPLTLSSAGAINESGSGAIDALKLKGSSTGATTLNGANVITDLGTFTSGSTFALTDDHDLAVDGTVNAGSHTVDLTTKGSGHDIHLDAKVEAKELKLVSAATVTESKSGDIDVTELTGSSAGTAEMNSAKNTITDLSTFTSGGTFELTDDHDLTVDGTVKASGHTVELTTKGSDHDIALDDKIEAKELKLVSAATISENGSGDIDVTTLTGSSASTAEMNSAKNTIADLGAFTSGSAFELTDDHALKVDGTVNAGSHTVDLKTVGSKHNLAIDAKVEGGTVDLATTGEATESSAGAIDAKLLNVTANTGIELTSKKNDIKKLGTHKTKKGPNKVTL